MSSPVLDVTDLSKRFGDFPAVDGISFSIKPGEILGLLGPNGAGKTTTIQMLLGLVTPTAGSIRMFGMDLSTHREAILQRVNFSSTYISMPQSLTVEENLWVIARLTACRIYHGVWMRSSRSWRWRSSAQRSPENYRPVR